MWFVAALSSAIVFGLAGFQNRLVLLIAYSTGVLWFGIGRIRNKLAPEYLRGSSCSGFDVCTIHHSRYFGDRR